MRGALGAAAAGPGAEAGTLQEPIDFQSFFLPRMHKVSALGTATARQAPPAEARVVEFPGTPERAGRTFVCSVLFLDIVEYSKRPVAEQLQIKERFNAQVSQTIAEIPPQDRIILDTGDGVAISFLEDPEDALRVALTLTHWFALPGGIPVRAGINLGPVRLTRDINGQPNIIGDGINVAQRVMSFAQPGQLLVSRAFHEGVARFAESYATLFSYQGSRTDKHVREHEIFELSAAAGQALEVAERRKRTPRREGGPPAATIAAGARLMGQRRLAFAVTGLSLGALGAALVAFLQPDGGEPQEPAAVVAHAPAQPSAMPAVPAVPAAVQPESAQRPAQGDEPQRDEPQPAESLRAEPQPAEPQPAALQPAEPQPAEPQPAEQAPQRSGPSRPAAVAPERVVDAAPAPAPRVPREPAASDADADTKTVQAPWNPPASSADPVPPVPVTKVRTATGATALVLLAISPWGEVYVNGKSVGVSPPLAEVELKPGKHRIEVRNGSFKPYQEDMELGSNQTVRIKHKFTHAR
jgi:class 3 adenylate cyclase